jgi:enoyl-CoA hydratase
MRMRLTRAAFQRGISMAATFTGDAAIAAGWLDEIVEPDAVLTRAQQVAAEAAAALNAGAHVGSKLKARADAILAIRAGIDGLPSEFAG